MKHFCKEHISLLCNLKELLTQKWKFAENELQFKWTDLDTFIITSLAYQSILCNELVLAEWEFVINSLLINVFDLREQGSDFSAFLLWTVLFCPEVTVLIS